ncbi:hypothetical protein ACH5RR_015487, partial [Cinchona calisaya]
VIAKGKVVACTSGTRMGAQSVKPTCFENPTAICGWTKKKQSQIVVKTEGHLQSVAKK